MREGFSRNITSNRRRILPLANKDGEKDYTQYHFLFRHIEEPFLIVSPSDDAVNNCLLFAGGASQVDASGLNALVAHQIGKERDVIELLEKVLGIAMSERVRVNHFGVQPELDGVLLQLLRDAARCDALPKTIKEQITGGSRRVIKPNDSFFTQGLGNVEATHFASFSVDVEVTAKDVLGLELNQFAHTSACCSKKANDKVPLLVTFLF